MTDNIASGDRGGGINWRVIGWSAAASILLLPFVAMQFTREVNWTAFDFLFAAIMLAVAGGTLELAARRSISRAYRGGIAIAVAAAFPLIWVNVAVGFLGSEDNDANAMFLAVIGIALTGSFLARFRAAGMARTMRVTAASQAAVGAIGLAAGWASPGSAGLYEVALGTTLFGGLWLLSAWLFQRDVRTS